ncbi:MAG: MFS transporter [Lachnospiraceae bacterium]|nr:MFS transporter [Lachnospiraceae bacterium]
MSIILIIMIYLAFISLGLPDSLSGAAWPVLRVAMDAPLYFAGLLTMTVTVGTIASSLLSDRLTRKFGTGLVTAVSTIMVGLALILYSTSTQIWQLFIWSIPVGLGGGSIDAALNNYVALNYTSRHMSWLHCCWGVGAAISPGIMGYFIANNNNWAGGYRTVGIIQSALAIILFISLPLWKKSNSVKLEGKAKPIGQSIKIKGVKLVMAAFLAYCALEVTVGLWASSYLVDIRGIEESTAATFLSLYFIGITAGRFLTGFIVDKVGDKNMIRGAIVVMFIGVALIFMPLNTLSLSGLVVMGLGNAPVYPAIIHSTPANFGQENSQSIIGIEMASAYLGATLAPPVFGFIAQNVSLSVYPVFLLVMVAVVLGMTERLNKVLGENDRC